MSRNLTIQNLNSAYVSLIKMVLNGSYPIQSPYIKSFYHDPSPSEAYQILQKVISQQKRETKKQTFDSSCLQNHQNSLQFKTRTPIKIQRKLNDKNSQQFNGLKLQVKNANTSNLKKNQLSQSSDHKNIDLKDTKMQKLRKITGKLTGIFYNNQKKINQYAETAKNPVLIRPELFLARNENSFKKY